MSSWEVRPFEGLGPLAFGSARHDVRRLLGPYWTFENAPGAVETDCFDGVGVHAHYDEAGRLELAEAFHPAEITLDGKSLIGRPAATVFDELESTGRRPRHVEGRYRIDSDGLALIVENGQVRGVSVFRRGYRG